MFVNRLKPEQEGGEGAFPPVLFHLPNKPLVPASESLPFTQHLEGSGKCCITRVTEVGVKSGGDDCGDRVEGRSIP